MSTINSTSNLYNVYTQSNGQVSNAQGKTRMHHHHKAQAQDSTQFSKEGLEALSSSTQGASSTAPKSPLDSLVANGTITQDQENSIKSAFQSMRQANQSGTYGSKPTNPISSLVANGTITQDQADAIKSAFQLRAQANQGQAGVQHHHHHHRQQIEGVTESSQTTSQTKDNSTETSGSSS